jgi:hypothetical protein
MAIGGLAMKLLLAGMVTAAIGSLAVNAQAAENVCTWTGLDWACGDGHVYTTHYPASSGPGIIVTPSATINQARAARLADPSPPR